MFEKLCECGKSKKSFKYDIFERFHNTCCDESTKEPTNPVGNTPEVTGGVVDGVAKAPDVIAPFLPETTTGESAVVVGGVDVVIENKPATPIVETKPVIQPKPTQSNKTRGRKPTKSK